LDNAVRYIIVMPRVQDISFRDQLGDAIVARRQWLAISQADLAERLEVSPSQMGRYERGADQVSALMLARIATALGTSPNDLLGYGNSPEGATDHLRELSTILADPDIHAVIRAMLGLDQVERKSVNRIVQTWAESFEEVR